MVYINGTQAPTLKHMEDSPKMFVSPLLGLLLYRLEKPSLWAFTITGVVLCLFTCCVIDAHYDRFFYLLTVL